MNASQLPVGWCVLQATIIAGLGLAAAWILGRRSPASAATAAAAAAATIAATTLLVPVRLPVPLFGGATVQLDVVRLGNRGADLEQPAARRGDDAQASASLSDLAAAARRAWGAAANADRPVGPRTQTILFSVVAACAIVGLFHFAAALRFVSQLRRRRSAVRCARTSALFVELRRALAVAKPVELCESELVPSPAVIGWRRPVVLLPAHREGWSFDQLRAALAHELAHVARNDFQWRAAASLIRAIHYYHPLVHWLTRRFALMQELATDRLAAAASGGRANYLRALSELAIRLDDQSRLRPEPLVLPALSSNLTRRITMLRSKEGSHESHGMRAGGVLAAGLIALLGAATTALRGAAEDVQVVESPITSPSEMFARTPIDPALIGHDDLGLFVVRLSELSQRSAFAPLFPMCNELFRQNWRQMFGEQPTPVFKLEAIDYIAGAPTLGVRPKTGEKEDQKGRVMVGAGEFIVRFRNDVAWRDWIRQYLPGSEEIIEDGFSFVRLRELPALGPGRICVAARDNRTLVFTANHERLRIMAEASDARSPSLAATWTALDGGLVTLLSTAPKLGGGPAADDAPAGPAEGATPSAMDPSAPLIAALKANVRQVGAAFDLEASTNRAEVRLCLICPDEKAADAVRLAALELMPVAKSIRPIGESEWKAASLEMLDFWMGLLDTITFEVDPQEDGTTHLLVAATAPFPTQLVQAEAVAEKPSASEPERR